MADPPIPVTPHIWTKEHKLLLCVLSRYFKTRGTDDDETLLVGGAERILCCAFAAQLGRMSSSPWITHPAVRRMIYELGRKEHECWKAVFIDADIVDAAGQWDSTREQLMQAASDISIRLVRRKKDHPIAYKLISALRKQMRIPKTPTRPLLVSVTRLSDTEPRNFEAAFRDTERNTANASYDHYNYASRVAGRVAFRVYTPSSHSINGLDGCYAGAVTGMLSPPPLRSSSRFMDGAYIHLRPLAQASPFLSVTTSLLVALRLALWKGKTGVARIAIIDLGAIGTASEQPGRLTPSKAIVNNMKNFTGTLQHTRDGQAGDDTPASSERREYAYNCMTEFLIWEHIPANAIMNVVGADELLSFAKFNPAIDQNLHISKLGDFSSAFKARRYLHALKPRLTRRMGQSVGSFLKFLGFDIVWSKKVAIKMQTLWNINRHSRLNKGYTKHIASNNRAAYLCGMLEGWCDGVSMEPPHSTTVVTSSGASSGDNDSDDDVIIIDDNNSDDDEDVIIIEDDKSDADDVRMGQNSAFKDFAKIRKRSKEDSDIYEDWLVLPDDDVAESDVEAQHSDRP